MPSRPTLVQSAQQAPGKCIISGDFNGPFIDLGHSIPRIGRIYISIKHVAPFMREAGWVPRAEVADRYDEIDRLAAEAEDAFDRAGRYDEIVEALAPLLPQPEPIVKQIAVPDREAEQRVADARADVEGLRRIVEDYAAELDELRRERLERSEPPAESRDEAATEAGATVEVSGQTVDLDALLDRKVTEITAVAEGWPTEALEALVAREVFLASGTSTPPRKTVLGLLDTDEDGGEEE